MRILDEISILRALEYLGYTEGWRDASSYKALVDSAEVEMPSQERLIQALEQMESGSIASTKEALKRSVDRAAEAERLRYITAGAGQSLTYMQKSDEARRYLSADNPAEKDYPLLAAEVGITAGDLNGVATIVLDSFTQWQQIGAAIEAARLGGKAAIEAAENASDAQAAFDAIAWPIP